MRDSISLCRDQAEKIVAHVFCIDLKCSSLILVILKRNACFIAFTRYYNPVIFSPINPLSLTRLS